MSKRSSQRATLGDWISGARLRTLPLAVAPVAVGYGVADAIQSESLPLSLLALAVAVFLQIGVNYANDYSDGIRGTDDFRVGPMRLTGAGLASAKSVRNVAFTFFGLAAVAGLAIVFITSMWWLIAVGAVCIVAAWFYTGGKHPYGYAGFGELFVFIFFGLVATIGTVAIQVENFFVNPDAVLWALGAAVSMGFFASAVLMINNIRDIATDTAAGKKTLAVRVGKRCALVIYFAFLWLPMVLLFPYAVIFAAAGFTYGVLFLLIPLTIIVATAETAKEYVLALKLTSFAALAYGLLLSYGLTVVV